MDCQICKELGKKQCGYHRFKAQFLSRSPSKTSSISVLTRSNSSILTPQVKNQNIRQQNQKMIILPKNISPTKITFMNRSPQHNLPISTTQKIVSNHQAYLKKNPSQLQFPPANRREIILNRQNIQIIPPHQGVYYPIYPIYEIIYEPQNAVIRPYDHYLP